MTSTTPTNLPLVLLVDDSVDVHRLLQARLRHEQFQLIGATSGAEALQLAETMPVACILLDLDMPVMDGFEVLRALKDKSSTHSVPVIVLSGLNSSDDKVTAFDLGATDYVTKPFDLSELRARLRASLRLNHLLTLLAERADVDGLTGLGNRAHFNKRWSEQFAEASRYGHALSLAMLDVDHFKKINDTYGHPAGDEVLQRVASVLQSSCRQFDVPCRFGGEEFALIMPNTGPADAAKVAERIRQEMADLQFPRHPEQRMTISIGLAGTDGGVGAMNAEEWLESADKGLYQAKRTGRNKVTVNNLTPSQTLRLAKAG
ncbi:MAG: diguanylate cyclase [Phycisphaeraceae bacterium]|nr:diguanylate cyclase [Phycisphaeraceae bacterium]